MVAIYKPNRRAFARYKRSEDVGKVTDALAEIAKDYAESIAPVRTGEYRASFRIEPRVVDGVRQSLLVNDAGHAVIVETHLHGGMRVMGRAVDVAERAL